MLGASYPTKKALRESIGKPLRFVETSLFNHEYTPDGQFAVVGPCPYTSRKWYAQITMSAGLIKAVK